MSGKNFIVLKASAGSGKTYALVRYYLLLALRSEYPRYYRHILAITFTNAAAAEMKQRVLDRLKELSTPGFHSELAEDIRTNLGIQPEQLQIRASRTYRDMLHHYSQISILTIDSFTHRIIRSFARDLHLAHDFNIEIDDTVFLEKLVDQCLNNIGSDEELTNYLVDYARENADEGKSWMLRNNLIKTSGLILQDETREALSKLPFKSLYDFTVIRKKISADCRLFEKTLKDLAQPALKILRDNEISNSDFSNAGNGNISVLKSISNGEFKKTPGPKMIQLITGTKWHSAKASAESIEKINSIRDSMLPFITAIVESYNKTNLERYKMRRKILKNFYALGLLETLTEYGSRLRQEENTILIADFQRIINEVVRDNDAPFIYERTGNRYKHILFDEFQDTSQMQWSNTIPLITNSLAENNLSLIVGDAKQSIYRWRGGDVRQFVKLPEVSEKTGQPQATSIFSQHIQIDHLQFNRRSARQIISFNNAFFRELSGHLQSYKNVYDDVEQKASRDAEGFVQVVVNDQDDSKEMWATTTAWIMQFIRECLADGYRCGDIAILTNKGKKEGSKIAAWLMQEGIPVVTRDSFLLQNSAVVRITMGLLEYINDPDRHFAAIDVVQSLASLKPEISMHDFMRKYTKRNGRKFTVDLNAFLQEIFGTIPPLANSSNIYRQAIDILAYFDLETDVATEFLLEKIRQLCIGRNYTLAEFVDWWNEEKEQLSTSASENEDAINILTVHKSKGLQYPVVIYVRMVTKDNPQEKWVDLDPAVYGLPTAYVTVSKIDSEDTESEFPDEFNIEKENRLLDEMNVCYVANTRAENRFYFLQEYGSRNTEMSKLIIQTLKNQYPELASGNSVQIGIRDKYTHHSKSVQSEVIRFNGIKNNSDTLRFIPASPPLSEEREYGNLLHQCLGYIQSHEDAANAVQRACALVNMTNEQIISQLQADVNALVTGENTATWFSAESMIFPEREICTADGKIIRPDRVVVRPEMIHVIDFKTGSPKPEHHDQVKLYMQHLQVIYEKPVRGFLYYTSGSGLIEVTE